VFGVIIALIILPSFAPNITNFIVGSAPVPPSIPLGDGGIYYPPMVESNASGVSSDIASGTMLPVPMPVEPTKPTAIDKQWLDYYNASNQYYQNLQTINDVINSISPIYDFGNKIFTSIMYKQGGQVTPPIVYDTMKAPAYYMPQPPTLLDSLSYVWNSILALLVEMAIAMAVSYVVFMRTDIR
jgi:ABC-type transport system involved in multi-copper enzyme maturation permease subunit